MAEYIEREAAVKVAEKYGLANGSALGRHTGLADCIASEIADIHAADVAPVRHARWVQVIVHVEVDDGFVDRVSECCSACHESNGRRRTYFCPNCGAKMDLEEEK